MKKHALLVILFTILATFTFAQKNEEQLIRECFERYRADLLNNNGDTAPDDISLKTIQYYTDILELVRTADSSKIETLSFSDKMLILMIRLKVPKEEILEMEDGKSFFRYATINGLAGREYLSNAGNTLGEIKINGNLASAEFLAENKASGFYIGFCKEEGKWKVDITGVSSINNQQLEALIKKSGKNENEILLLVVQSNAGKKVTPQTWLPLK